MFKQFVKVFTYGVFLTIVLSLMGMKSMDAEQLEAWFNDFEDDSEQRALAVNEGDLEFLKSIPIKPHHQIHNTFTISKKSLRDGWVKMVQCHNNLDVVSVAQILYHGRRTRHLKVVSNPGIDRAWVDKNSVQLENISPRAKLCVQAEVHSLYPNYNGTYSMHNGPFLRKFLDGYYPMRVTMDVNLPSDQLTYEATNPQAQDGFEVTQSRHGMKVNALFVGELSIEVMFSEKDRVFN